MKKIITLIFFLIACTAAYAGEIFQFNYKPGQRFFIEGFVNEDLYRNDIFIKRISIKNTGDLLVTEVKDDRAFHEGVYRYYTGEEISGDYILVDEYPSKFYRDIYGNYEISEMYFMPVVRGVPTFPETEVEIGDQWSSRAYEAHDFRQLYGILKPVLLPAAVSYQYIGNTEIGGEKIAKISINYVINYTLKYSNDPGSDIPMPYRIIGYFNQLFLWNLDKGLPHSYKENFDYVFIMSNGETVEYTGKANATLSVTQEPRVSLKNAEQIMDKLQDKIPSVEVTKTDQGIVINIGEIIFKFDSDELVEGATEDLANIVEVLKEFSDRNIRVIGHTDSRGPQDYNRSLSLRRAKKTVVELKKILPELYGRITYMGMGENKPIADNETEEGRKKNRRVEIIILDP
ncbi:MAG TPA: OmpA family protein [Spirochaetes bacterium]|nr:OmpA family protein [Spirochaetota bacterium]